MRSRGSLAVETRPREGLAATGAQGGTQWMEHSALKVAPAPHPLGAGGQACHPDAVRSSLTA